MMRIIAPLFALILFGCKPLEKEKATIELRADTTLVVYQTVRNGYGDGSIHTSLSVRWPHSQFFEDVGKADYFQGSEDIRLIELSDRYLLIYGPSIYHRNKRNRSWTHWQATNSGISPPTQSVVTYLRDWFIAHNYTDFQHIPFGSVLRPNERVPFEEIAFLTAGAAERITFGSMTRWTIPYRFDSADSKENRLYYKTEHSFLPPYLVFSGVFGYFGGWFFDMKATYEKNKNTKTDH